MPPLSPDSTAHARKILSVSSRLGPAVGVGLAVHVADRLVRPGLHEAEQAFLSIQMDTSSVAFFPLWKVSDAADRPDFSQDVLQC
jgi:hypothetical protein